MTRPYPGWPAFLVSLLVLGLTLGTLAAVILRSRGGTLQAADWAALRFTLLQAALSAMVSVGLAIPLARALARRQFAGRGLLIVLLGAPFILPVIVAIFGLLSVFGRNGVISILLGWVGLPPMSIYGLHGVVLAHVFFNLPLATRLILQGWTAIPVERFRLAASLGVPVSRLLERPMLQAVVPGVTAIVFLLCLTSFAVALTLGGGPAATTVELAIYQALRFDFDLGRAAVLATLQFGICAMITVIVVWMGRPLAIGVGLDRVPERYETGGVGVDALLIGGVTVFLGLPLVMAVGQGVPGLRELPLSVWFAMLRSVAVSLASVALLLAMVLALSVWPGRLREVTGMLPLAASSLVMGTGLYLLLANILPPARLALPLTAVVNAVMALPFALRAVAPAADQAESGYGRLATSLNLSGWTRARWLLLPRIRPSLGFAAGLTAAISMGDLGIVALFADTQTETLPLAMSRLMGAYRMEAAAGAGLLLLTVSLGLFWVFDRAGRADAAP